MESERVTRALERLAEDSSLTEDLTDSAATRALAWAETSIKAADRAPDDEAFSAQVQAVRAALRSAAKQASSGDEVVAMAEQTLAGEAPAEPAPAASAPPVSAGGDPAALLGAAPTPSVSTPSGDPAALLGSPAAASTAGASSLPPTAPAATAPRSQRRSWRRRLRNWIHRKG